MSITFHCTCGKRMKAKDEFAGRPVRCPQCGTVLTIPAAGGLADSASGADTGSSVAPRPGTPPSPGSAAGAVATGRPPSFLATDTGRGSDDALDLPWLRAEESGHAAPEPRTSPKPHPAEPQFPPLQTPEPDEAPTVLSSGAAPRPDSGAGLNFPWLQPGPAAPPAAAPTPTPLAPMEVEAPALSAAPAPPAKKPAPRSSGSPRTAPRPTAPASPPTAPPPVAAVAPTTEPADAVNFPWLRPEGAPAPAPEPRAAAPAPAPSRPAAPPRAPASDNEATARLRRPEVPPPAAAAPVAPVAPAPTVAPAPSAPARTSGSDSILTQPAALSSLVVGEPEPLAPRAAKAPTSDDALPRVVREPWYVPFVESAARFVLAANVVLTIAVPAFLLLGGLVALVKAGDPRALLSFHLGPIPLAYSLLGLLVGMACAALFWAAPMLIVLDLSRRLRVLSKRVDGIGKSLEEHTR